MFDLTLDIVNVFVFLAVLSVIALVAFTFTNGIQAQAGQLDPVTSGLANMWPVFAFMFPVLYLFYRFRKKPNEYGVV